MPACGIEQVALPSANCASLILQFHLFIEKTAPTLMAIKTPTEDNPWLRHIIPIALRSGTSQSAAHELLRSALIALTTVDQSIQARQDGSHAVSQDLLLESDSMHWDIRRQIETLTLLRVESENLEHCVVLLAALLALAVRDVSSSV